MTETIYVYHGGKGGVLTAGKFIKLAEQFIKEHGDDRHSIDSDDFMEFAMSHAEREFAAPREKSHG